MSQYKFDEKEVSKNETNKEERKGHKRVAYFDCRWTEKYRNIFRNMKAYCFI